MDGEIKEERKKPGPKPKEKPATYENTSKRNIFTVKGWCWLYSGINSRTSGTV